MQGLSTLGRTLTNIGMIYLIAFVLELIIVLPLMTGVRKFMLRVIRLKNRARARCSRDIRDRISSGR